ncbi:MAG: fumarate reductase subunit C [Planctomycetota bacterium]
MSARFQRHIPWYWVFTRGTWFIFFLREITCLFVGWFAVLTFRFARAVAAGPEEYDALLGSLRSPGMIVFNCVSLVAALWHTVTWFQAAPKAMRPRVGDKLVAPSAILGGHYAAWLAVSAALAWVLL